jgi:hypothetical protein
VSCTVEEKESKSADPEHLCQGVSPGDELCDYRATVHCVTRRWWLCYAHAENEFGMRACSRLEKKAARHLGEEAVTNELLSANETRKNTGKTRWISILKGKSTLELSSLSDVTADLWMQQFFGTGNNGEIAHRRLMTAAGASPYLCPLTQGAPMGTDELWRPKAQADCLRPSRLGVVFVSCGGRRLGFGCDRNLNVSTFFELHIIAMFVS